ncbi:hypothetical protein EV03_0284 [Prochlorococcus marinus str. PAC1]|uniref:Uncharacterized protein n=1 Tax=Prochlorococcus marinus str. PAC1 TaxID=59924 RepID=A0A0A2CAN9_PROMR|nr:hypothetical protein EV03_0284 [Prochlorococcus marinus str. PAC1]
MQILWRVARLFRGWKGWYVLVQNTSPSRKQLQGKYVP